MGKFTVIPQDTFEGLQLDAGVLLYRFNPESPAAPADEDIICATTGGITVSCVPTYSDFGEDVDNCPVNTKELKHLDSWECKMSFTSLGTSPESIRLALGAADINASSGKITPRRDLEQTDFSDIWWVGDRADGGMVAARLINALSTSGFSLKTSKNGKGQVSVELTGHVSINAQSVVPMEFYSMESGNVEIEKIGVLTVTSVAGTSTGDTSITVSPAKSSVSNVYRYNIDDSATSVTYGQNVQSWTTWDGSSDITATSGKVITVVEADSSYKALKVGNATVVSQS